MTTPTPIESPACAPARARVEALLRPISAEARAGRDAREDPRAEFLRDEMLKDGYTRRDWSRIEQAARMLLCETTKDLVVAASWASAAYETEGLQGLASGLALLTGLLTGYWEDMLPPVARRKVRESAIENFYEHLSIRLQARTAGPDDADDLSACTELLEDLHRAAQIRYTPAPPSHRPLRDALAQLHASLPKPVSQPPPAANTTNSSLTAPAAAASAVTPPKPAARPEPEAGATRPAASAEPAPPLAPQAAPRAGASLEDLTRNLGEATQHLPKIAAGLRRHQPEASLPYRLLRVAAWLRAVEPSADPQGRAALDPLPPATRAQCDALARAGRWSELLDASETALTVPAQRFALDLQRHTASALAGLGHHDARTAVLAELAALLRRMPGLPRLLARDGTPLADADTLALLARERLTPDSYPEPAPPRVTPATSASSAPAQPSTTPPLHAARQRLATGDRAGALEQLQQAVEAAASSRQRFDRRIDLAILTHEAGLAAVARAQLSALEREATERRLAEWEPQLLARVLDPLLAILRTAPRPTDTADISRLFDLLCTLDPVAAARHSPR